MEAAASNIVRLLNSLLGLGQDKFDVARVRHVRVDLDGRRRSASSLATSQEESINLLGPWARYVRLRCLGGLVDLDVLDDQVASIESLGVGIGLGIPEKT